MPVIRPPLEAALETPPSSREGVHRFATHIAQSHPLTPPVVCVVGATATGKSALAMAIARSIGGEVINADSMQLYKGMDIGTAKVTPAERRLVPHHLLDIWDISTPASVAEYQRLARCEIDRLLAVGRTPVLVGGSGLYIRAAIDHFDFPQTDPYVRSRLEAELTRFGPEYLHSRLAALDSMAAESISPGNGRRIVRALEVIELTGVNFSATLPEFNSFYETVHIGLSASRSELDQRIRLRVKHMWKAGLEDEVRRLEKEGLRASPTAVRAIGYRETLSFISEECSRHEAQRKIIHATRRYARRQETWFRRDKRIQWFAAGNDAELTSLLQKSLKLISLRRPSMTIQKPK